MATTRADIRTRLQAHGYETDTASAQDTAIELAYKRLLNIRRWTFMWKQATIAAVAGTQSYALTAISDLKDIDAVRIEFGTDYPYLEYLAPQQFRDRQHTYRDRGLPLYWTRLGGNLHLWPIPDKAYTITVDYIHDAPDLNADGTNMVVPDTAADVLVYGALSILTYRERDWDGHAAAKQLYSEHLAEMLAEYGMPERQSPDRVVESGFHQQFDLESPWLT